MVAPAPVDPMRFKRVAAVGTKKHDASARLQHPHHLRNCGLIVLHVFQYLVAEDQVDTAALERQIFSRAADHQGCESAAVPRAWEFYVQAQGLPAERRDAAEISAHAAAVHQDAPMQPFAGSLQQHPKPALLPGAPDARRLAADSGFVQIFRYYMWHGCYCTKRAGCPTARSATHFQSTPILARPLRCFSTAIPAIAPSEAAITACLMCWQSTSPTANTPGIWV